MVFHPVFDPRRKKTSPRWRGVWATATIATAAVLLVLAGGASVGAQETVPPPPPLESDTEATAPTTSATANDPLADRAPYNNWKHHTGAPKDCVVLVRATDASGSATTFSGIVVRCDGFVLVPKGVYAAFDSHAPLSVAPAPTATESGDILTAPLLLAGRLHSGSDSRVDYGMVKINGHHLRCLRPLTARVLQPGMAVRIVGAVPNPRDPAHCLVRSWDAKVGTSLVDPGSTTGAHWSLSDLKATIDAADSPATPVLGAAVIDPESGAVVGMITQAGAAPVFSSWAHLGDIVSEVGIAPSRASVKRSLDEHAPARIAGTGVLTGHWRKGEMVRIPGGPVLLSGKLAFEYRSAYHTDIACTPDFYLDVYPVSLDEYRAWLLAHPNQPSPRSWLPNERQNPERRPDLPATGMASREAASFAADRDVRLVTEVEWQRGAARLSPSALTLLQSEAAAGQSATAEVLKNRGAVRCGASGAGGHSAGAGTRPGKQCRGRNGRAAGGRDLSRRAGVLCVGASVAYRT